MMASRKKPPTKETAGPPLAQQIWLAGLGALSLAERGGTRVFHGLVEQGEAYEEKGRERVKRVRTGAREGRSRAKSSIKSSVHSTLGRLGVPTREELQELTERVEALTAALNGGKKATKKRTAKKKTTKKKAPVKKKTTKKTTARKS
jgi:poly(hydroxyalkanoate) granule-associated protein